MSVTNAIASVAVRELGPAVAWYDKLLGRPADSRPNPQLAEWRFDRGGGLQVYQLRDRAGRGSVTLAVDSLDEQIAHLQRLGIDPGEPLGSPTIRVVMIKDPDGNSIAFAQVTARHPTT